MKEKTPGSRSKAWHIMNLLETVSELLYIWPFYLQHILQDYENKMSVLLLKLELLSTESSIDIDQVYIGSYEYHCSEPLLIATSSASHDKNDCPD